MLVNGEKVATLNVETLFSKRKQTLRTLNVGPHGQAQYLVEKFEKVGCSDAERCFRYFVKCFQTLPENIIWDIYETATRKPGINSPIKYFIGACRNNHSVRFKTDSMPETC